MPGSVTGVLYPEHYESWEEFRGGFIEHATILHGTDCASVDKRLRQKCRRRGYKYALTQISDYVRLSSKTLPIQRLDGMMPPRSACARVVLRASKDAQSYSGILYAKDYESLLSENDQEKAVQATGATWQEVDFSLQTRALAEKFIFSTTDVCLPNNAGLEFPIKRSMRSFPLRPLRELTAVEQAFYGPQANGIMVYRGLGSDEDEVPEETDEDA